MATYWHILVFSLLGGIVSLLGGIALLSRDNLAKRFAVHATPFAAGSLLAAVFLDLLPEGIEVTKVSTVMLATLAGIVIFFFLQRFLHSFHHHGAPRGSLTNPKVGLIVLGDTLHNALDGVAIAASFLISIPTGIVTTIAVATHEIPQEIGDMGLLLARGVSRRRVIIINIVSALMTTVFALITFTLGSENALPVGVLLGLSAGFLLYIATSDIIPALHEEQSTLRKRKLIDVPALLLLAGIAVVALSIDLAHRLVPYEEPVQPATSEVCEHIEHTDHQPTTAKTCENH